MLCPDIRFDGWSSSDDGSLIVLDDGERSWRITPGGVELVGPSFDRPPDAHHFAGVSPDGVHWYTVDAVDHRPRSLVSFDGEDWNRKLQLYPHRIDWRDGLPQPNKADAQPIPLEPTEPLRLECDTLSRIRIPTLIAILSGS